MSFYKEPVPKKRFTLQEGKADHGQVRFRNTASGPKQAKGLKARIASLFKTPSTEHKSPDLEVTKDIESNLALIKAEFHVPLNQDLVIREFKVLGKSAFLAYMEGMTDSSMIESSIMRQLINAEANLKMGANTLDYVTQNILASHEISFETELPQIVLAIVNGFTALFIDGSIGCVTIDTVRYEKRAVSTPLREFVVKGPNEAFMEDSRTNITLLRRILRNKDLVTETFTLSSENAMNCGLLYLENLANPQIVAEVKKRLTGIDLDYINEGSINQLIEDHPTAIFPQTLNTERPDRTAALLMQGRVGIFFDGIPGCIIVPMNFFQLLYASEDFYLRWQYGTFLRILRLVTTNLAIFLPGFYIGLTLYHQEIIPTGLLHSMIQTRKHLPFPAPLELLFMELAWELVREAGVRVPGIVGQTLGIVGGVILGEAAVQAGLVSPILIIVVAVTGLANFAIPDFSIAFGIRILRFVFFLLGTVAGFYGLAVGICVLFSMAASMNSFGLPYFSPLAPTTKGPPISFTQPMWKQKSRPDSLNPQKRARTTGLVRRWTKE